MIRSILRFLFERNNQNENLINNMNKYDNDRRKKENKLENISKNKSVL